MEQNKDTTNYMNNLISKLQEENVFVKTSDVKNVTWIDTLINLKNICHEQFLLELGNLSSPCTITLFLAGRLFPINVEAMNVDLDGNLRLATDSSVAVPTNIINVNYTFNVSITSHGMGAESVSKITDIKFINK